MKQGNKKTENSEKIVCKIAMKLPSLNEYVNACRTNPYKASKFKQNIENDIGLSEIKRETLTILHLLKNSF